MKVISEQLMDQMATIATVDLKSIHEIYKGLKKDYSQYSQRFLYFLATCLYLDPDLDLDNALKLRPNVGLIGIDISSLDKYFKNIEITCHTPRSFRFCFWI